jgi:ATP-dependent DNA helicase RecQ
VAEQEIGKQLLADTVSYAETSMCRRKFLLHYFGESLCRGTTAARATTALCPRKISKRKDDLALVLQAIKESKERHRARFICDLLTGTETSEIKNYKGDKLKAYGSGSEKEANHWMGVIRQANVGGFLHKDIETYGNLSLTEAGKKFQAKPVSITFAKERDYVVDDSPDDEPIVAVAAAVQPMKSSWMLRDLRHTMAKEATSWHRT